MCLPGFGIALEGPGTSSAMLAMLDSEDSWSGVSGFGFSKGLREVGGNKEKISPFFGAAFGVFIDLTEDRALDVFRKLSVSPSSF